MVYCYDSVSREGKSLSFYLAQWNFTYPTNFFDPRKSSLILNEFGKLLHPLSRLRLSLTRTKHRVCIILCCVCVSYIKPGREQIASTFQIEHTFLNLQSDSHPTSVLTGFLGIVVVQ